ncbi:MAG: SDR family oxidoreductase [Selenomonadaceae bacterium]|nr:SDR family oxidoreductase [Selenomonadaceae bacterium]
MKTAVITGGTSGIGLATTKKFLSENYNCVLVGRSEKKFIAIKNELFGNFEFFSADVGKISDCEKILKFAVEKFGGVDVLINSAGIYTEGAINSVDEKIFDEIFKTNVKGTFFMCRACVDELIKTKGTIVNISSDAGFHGNYFCALYSASKGAVIAFTKSLALELANFSVRVNCVAPGDILTPMTENQLKISGEKISDLEKFYPLGRIGKAEEVAEAIFFLASEKSNFITGEILKVDGGLTA